MLDSLLARAYDPLLARAERGALGQMRAALLSDVGGHVLVLGAGTGADIRHLAPDVDRLTLVEPSAPMRARLEHAIPAHLVDRTEVLLAFAEDLPVDDASVDHVVTSLVLCSVHDPERAVASMARILRPGGTVRLLEHGAAAGPMGARIQRLANPTWRRIAGGCNLTRDPRELMAQRFEVDDLAVVDLPPVSRLGQVTAGVARPVQR